MKWLPSFRLSKAGPTMVRTRRMRQVFLRSVLFVTLCSLLCICFGLSPAYPQTSKPQNSEALQQLLSMPALPPRTSGKDDEAGRQRPQQFFDKNRKPPDHAPIGDLVDYWGRWAGASDRDAPTPSATVKARLLDACEADPEILQRLLPVLPQTNESAERVKKLYDAAQNHDELDSGWRDAVHKWLLYHSNLFLSDLVSLANKVKDKDGYVSNEEALDALAKVDWQSAEMLLNGSSSSSQPRTAAKALALLYEHARASKDESAEEQYRQRLKVIAADRNAPARARDAAIEALSLTEWAGRDEWYLSLLSDETLLEPTDGSYLFSPLTTLFDSNPDKWIPVMSRLVESKTRSIQQAAASCLVEYATEHPRRDAILPVIRWLSDPDWLPINGTQRAWFMQKMDELDMPESVPGLIWIVENEKWNRKWAARTLAHYKDPRAIPALRRALSEEPNEDDRQYILEGLVASGGVTEAEQIAALWAYAATITTAEGREEAERYRSFGDESLPVPVSIGRYLARKKNVSENLVAAVLKYAESQRARHSTEAQALLEVTRGWQARQVDLDIVRRIVAGTADANTIANALERRAKLRGSVGSEVRALSGLRVLPEALPLHYSTMRVSHRSY